jgi:hypothetical protein
MVHREVLFVKEPLINSESFSCAGKIRQIKAPIAGKTQSNRCAHGASFSQPIAKIGYAELAYFNKQMLIHELIRGSLNWPGSQQRRNEPVLLCYHETVGKMPLTRVCQTLIPVSGIN